MIKARRLDILCELLETLSRNSEIGASYILLIIVKLVIKKYYINIVKNEKSMKELTKIIFNEKEFKKLCAITKTEIFSAQNLENEIFSAQNLENEFFSAQNLENGIFSAQNLLIFKTGLNEIKKWKTFRIKYNLIGNHK